jgi:hypothetical protein
MKEEGRRRGLYILWTKIWFTPVRWSAKIITVRSISEGSSLPKKREAG